MSERIREVPITRRTTTTYVAGRATIRVRVPKGWARGLVAGVEAAFAGWAITTVTTMVVYLSLRSNTWMSDTLPRDALALGGDLWVATLGGTSVAGGVSYRVIPTLFGALLILLVRLLLRTTTGFPRSSALFAVPGFLLTAWFLAGTSGVHSQWWTGTVGAVLIPLIGSGWFVVSSYSRDSEAPSMQHWISGGFKMGGLVSLVTVVAAAAAAVVALVAGWSRASGIQELLGASSLVDTTFIVGAQALFAPTAMAWAAAWWSGAGFMTATDSLHSPTVVDGGPIPPIPLLGTVPETAPGKWVIFVPVVLGIACGVASARLYRRSHLLHQSAQGLLASVVFVSIVALWMWSATMSMGSVRLAFMGPLVGRSTLYLFLEVALPAMLVPLVTHPTTLALVGQSAGRVRSEGEALRRRHAERLSREAATASLIEGDEAWAERRDDVGSADATEVGEPWAESAEAVQPDKPRAAWRNRAAWAESVKGAKRRVRRQKRVAWAEPADKDDEGDTDDPEAKGTKGEGLN